MQSCLRSVISQGLDSKTFAPLVKVLREEGQKHGIATSSAFVLVEWCSVIMQTLAGSSLWAEFGKDILLADAASLEKCLRPDSRRSLAHSAIIVTRRGFRKLFSSSGSGSKSLNEAVPVLAAKGTQPTAKHAPILGVIAGVSARQAALKPVLETLKPLYFDFFVREIVGCRAAPPEHITAGLSDFFSDFVTPDEVGKHIVPAVEKGLLRAPEVILNGVLQQLIQSLPANLDLSELLDGKLLKPLLSNVKSSNIAIRAGVLSAFRTIVPKCRDSKIMDHVVDEIAAPLKGGKLASPDHRIPHAEMLEVAPLSEKSAEIAMIALATVASKEGNEAALTAETSSLARTCAFALEKDSQLPKPVLDIISKGLTDKKPASRRLWLLLVGRTLRGSQLTDTSSAQSSFVESVTTKLVDTFNEVIKNPAAAVQSGFIVGAFVLTASYSAIQSQFSGSPASTALTKASIPKYALSVGEKHSFLLNHRVYSKVATEQDLTWLRHSLVSIAQIIGKQTSDSIKLGWAAAIIYLITASSVPPTIQQEAAKDLSRLYCERPSLISGAIIGGLWSHVVHSDDGESRAEAERLIQVIRSIVLDPEELEQLGAGPSKQEVEDQACALIVLARPELIPRSSWIDLCLKMKLDPGQLARDRKSDLLDEIGSKTSFDQKVCGHKEQSAFTPFVFINFLVLVRHRETSCLQCCL